MDTYLAGPGIMHWDFIVFKHNFHQLDEVKTFCKENNVHLDYACGPGTFIGKYVKKNSLGIDLSKDQIEYASDKYD